jgi:hypothetical protein
VIITYSVARYSHCYSMILLFIINDPDFFVSHRLPVALAAKQNGYDVHVASADGPTIEYIKSLGLTHHKVPLTRSGLNFIKELRSLIAIIKLMKTVIARYRAPGYY